MMEVPQLLQHDEKWYVFFSNERSHERVNTEANYTPESGLHCFVSDTLKGFYTPVNGNGIALGFGERIYDVRILEQVKGNLFSAIGWLNKDEKGKFIGRLSKPFLLSIEGDSISFAGVL
jgi:hypothetical protein